MLYRITLLYIIGLLAGLLYLKDMSFMVMSFIVLSFIFYIYIRDTEKDNYFRLTSFIPLLFFAFGYLHPLIEITHETTYIQPHTLYKMEGTITNVTTYETKKIVSMRTKTINSLENNVVIDAKLNAKYFVSSFDETKPGDMVTLVGELEDSSARGEKNTLDFPNFMKQIDEQEFYVSNIKKITSTRNTNSFWYLLINTKTNISETLTNRLKNSMSSPFGEIASGIVLGDKNNLSNEIKDIFKNSGLIHIMVLSGANVSFIILIIYWIISKIQIRSAKLKTTLNIFFSTLFVTITGFADPSLRALLMNHLKTVSELFGRGTNNLKILVFTFLLIALFQPQEIFSSASLHLTFLATFAVLFLNAEISKFLTKFFIKNNLSRVQNIWIFLVSTFLSINLLVTPYIFFLSGSANLSGTIATLFVEPIIILITINSFMIIISSFLIEDVSNILGEINNLLANTIFGVAKLFNQEFLLTHFEVDFTTLVAYYLVVGFMIKYLVRTNESKLGQQN